jgi:hypothetical protein
VTPLRRIAVISTGGELLFAVAAIVVVRADGVVWVAVMVVTVEAEEEIKDELLLVCGEVFPLLVPSFGLKRK